MNEILSVNAEDPTLVAEPGHDGRAHHVLLPMNLALQTHVEMESITPKVSRWGLASVTNFTAMASFRSRCSRTSCRGDSHGVRRQVTADSDPELFYALPWSHGTLGFTCLRSGSRTKPFIRMVYELTYLQSSSLHV